MEKMCFNAREAAEALGVSLPTFYELSNRAGFPRVKVGRRTLGSRGCSAGMAGERGGAA